MNDDGPQPIAGVRKITLLRANSLGDFVFCLPSLEALRRTYPRAEIVFLGRHWHAGFLSGRPSPIDRVVVVPYSRGVYDPPEGLAENPCELEDFFSRMRSERFDLAIQIHGGGAHSNPFVRQLGARIAIGLRAPGAPGLDLTVPYTLYHPEVLRYLEVVSLAGARPADLEPRLAVTPDDREEARSVLAGSDRPFAVIHPGATDPRRRWPASKFALAADALAAEGLDIVVTGDQSEHDLAASVCDAMRGQACNASGLLSLRGLAGILSRARVVLSNDSGPLHLARAVGTPAVGIYWVGNVITAGSLTLGRHRNLLSWRLNCPVCGSNCIEANCRHDDSFVQDVPVADVLGAVRELLSSLPRPGCREQTRGASV